MSATLLTVQTVKYCHNNNNIKTIIQQHQQLRSPQKLLHYILGTGASLPLSNWPQFEFANQTLCIASNSMQPEVLPTLLSQRIANVKLRQINIIAVSWLICMALVLQATSVDALRCYTCTYLETDMDNTCVMDANATQRITNCNKKYCTIMRQEAMNPAGKVLSFIRDCQDKPLFLNAVKADFTFKTYYRSCMTDLCNDSDGTQSATDDDPNFGASENTIIKGKRH